MDTQDFRAILKLLQEGPKYPPTILDLRKKRQLHKFVEWRLAELLRRSAEGIHVQPEKWGITNGRIDLAAYHSTRVVIHYEIIANNSSSHVFRDTTSLLVSRADTRLAILVDSDVDKSVSDAFFSAVPAGEIEFVWLRNILLEQYEQQTIGLIHKLLSVAQYRSGGLSEDAFQCELTSYEVEPLCPVEIAYRNAVSGHWLQVQIRTNDEVIPLGHFEVGCSPGTMKVLVPFDRRLTQGEHRLQVQTDGGERWATWIAIYRIPLEPSIAIEETIARPGESVQFSLHNFPPGREVTVFFWQDHAGAGVFSGSIPGSGHLAGRFSVPALISGRFIRTGEHKVTASIPGFEARCFVHIDGSLPPEEIRIEGTTSTSNQLFSLAISNMVIRRRECECRLEFLNKTGHEVSLQQSLATLHGPETRPAAVLISESGRLDGIRVAPGGMHSGSERFVLLEVNEGDHIVPDSDGRIELVLMVLVEACLASIGISISVTPDMLRVLIGTNIEVPAGTSQALDSQEV